MLTPRALWAACGIVRPLRKKTQESATSGLSRGGLCQQQVGFARAATGGSADGTPLAHVTLLQALFGAWSCLLGAVSHLGTCSSGEALEAWPGDLRLAAGLAPAAAGGAKPQHHKQKARGCDDQLVEEALLATCFEVVPQQIVRWLSHCMLDRSPWSSVLATEEAALAQESLVRAGLSRGRPGPVHRV